MLPDRADLQSTQGYVEQIKRISETLLHIGDHATLGKELLVTTALRAATLQRRNDEVAAFHLMYHDVSKRHSVGPSSSNQRALFPLLLLARISGRQSGTSTTV